MNYEDSEYGENPVDDMMTDYDYHINTEELPELFDESSFDEFSTEWNALSDDMANLNNRDWNMSLINCIKRTGVSNS